MVAGSAQARPPSPTPGAEGFSRDAVALQMKHTQSVEINPRAALGWLGGQMSPTGRESCQEISSGLVFHGIARRQVEDDLLPLDGHLTGRLDSDTDRIAIDFDDRYTNVRPQTKTLAELPAQDKHDTLLREPHQIDWIGSAINQDRNDNSRAFACCSSFHAKASTRLFAMIALTTQMR
jgi:hypothetical protein